MAIEVRSVTPLLQVYDMPVSLHFYRDLLGFKVVNTSPAIGPDRVHWALLAHGDAEMMLNTAYESDDERPPVREPASMAAHGDVTLYFGCPDIEAAYAELQARGLVVKQPQIAPYGMKQLDLSDPDGYRLCFQWPVAG